MRDRKGNFLRNPVFPSNVFNNNLNPRDSQNSSGPGIWSLRESDSDDSTGVANYDPFFNYVEFILKFEQQTGFQFPNSINRPYWFWHRETFGKSGKNSGWGTLTNERSRFGTRCYVIGSTSNTSVNDESLYMYGQNYSFSTTRSSFLNIGYNDFTFEGWIYLTSLNQGTSHIFTIFGKPNIDGTGGLTSGIRLAYNANGDGALRLSGTTNHNASVTSSSAVLSLNTWMHVAMVRKNGTARVFVNGTNVIESNNFNYAFSNSQIGMYAAPSLVTLGTSFADETRFTNGIARYWNNFTPPTTEFYVPNMSGNNGLVLPFDDNDQRDSVNPFLKDTSNKNVWIATTGLIKSTLNGTFTVTIASPGVFTKTEHGLQAGDTVTFSTTGSLPTGLTAGTTYFVISTGLTASSFRVSTTLNGAAVNTSGTQSGVHSLTVTSSIQPVARFANSLYSSSHASFFYLSPDTVPDTSDFNLSFWMRSMTANSNSRAPTTVVGGFPWNVDAGTYVASNGIDDGGRLFNLNGIMSLALGGVSYSYKSGVWNQFKGSLSLNITSAGVTASIIQTGINSILRDTWNHVHISRNGTTYRLFVNGTLSSSVDHYRATTLPSAKWQSMAFGNSTFVAVSGGDAASNIAASSADGITWTQRTLSGVLNGPTFTVTIASPAVFTKTNHGLQAGDTVVFSTTGSLPTGLTAGTTYFILSTGLTANEFRVSTALNGAAVNTSGTQSGVHSLTVTSGLFWSDVVYGDKFVAIAGGGAWNNSTSATTRAATSTDGINWTFTAMPSSVPWSAIAYGNGIYVAISGGPTNSNVAAYSSDGISWTASTLPQSTTWTSIAYGNGVFVAVSRGTIAATSPDGVTWTQRTLPSAGTGGWTSVCSGNNLFVLTSGGVTTLGTNVYATSIDGVTWTSRTLPSFGWWTKTIYGDNKYLMLSQDPITNTNTARTNSFINNCLLSSDGLNWTNVITPGTSTGTSDNSRTGSTPKIGTGTYGNGVFVGVHKSSIPTINNTTPAGTNGFISLPMPINKQYLMLGCNRNPVDENIMSQNTDGLSSRFNGYLEDIVITRSTGATTVTVPTAAPQPPRILY